VNCSPNFFIRSFFGLALVVLATTFAFSQAAPDQGSKPRHVITNDDISSSGPASASQSSAAANTTEPAKDASDGTAKGADASTSAPLDGDPVAMDDEMRSHQVGGVDPNEKPKDAIKRIDREENELRSKLDRFREKADTEKNENRRRMWLEAVDRQQITLQQMSEEKAKLQKSEDEKAQDDQSKTEAAGGDDQAQPASDQGQTAK